MNHPGMSGVSRHPGMLLYRVKGLWGPDVLRQGFETAAG
jgi:hypothetical protein